MSEIQTPEVALPCCFCGGAIVCGPVQDDADETAKLGFMTLAPGDGAAAFRAEEQEFYCHVACFRARLLDPSALRPFVPDDYEEVQQRLRGSCGELAASLFIDGPNLPFRQRLFAAPAGPWLPVDELIDGLPGARRLLDEIRDRADHDVTLLVSHHTHPLDPDYEMAVFAEPYWTWSTCVLHRRGY